MPDEVAEDESPSESKYGHPKWWKDAKRWSDGQIRGLNQKATEALTDEKNGMFAEVRAVPWKLNLAQEITHFARSTDTSSSVWPYERFESRLTGKGTPVPDGMSIAQAVEVVLSDLDRLSRPKTKGSMAQGTWYEKNIARPMSERFAASSLGGASFDELRSDESGVAHVYTTRSTESMDPSPWVDWLRGRTKDLDLETLSVLHMDVLRAPHLLRGQAHVLRMRVESARIGNLNAGGSYREGGDAGQRDAILELQAVEVCLAYSRDVADRVRTLSEFRAWLWRANEERTQSRPVLPGEWLKIKRYATARLAASAMNRIHERDVDELTYAAARHFCAALGLNNGVPRATGIKSKWRQNES